MVRQIDKEGYIRLYDPANEDAWNDGKILEHRVVAAEKLRRKLLPSEVVHHRDEDKTNNNPDNLMVFKTTADHTAYHYGARAVLEGDVYVCPDKTGKVKICPKCNTNFASRNADMCLECFLKEKGEHIPSKEQLLQDILTTSFVKLGEKYGVSDNAVRKWCKKYNLPYKQAELTKIKKKGKKKNEFYGQHEDNFKCK